MIIDSHLHVFDRNAGGAQDNFPLWPGTRWGAGEDDLLRQMDEAGIDRAFLISYTPVDVMAHYPPDRREHMVAVFQHYLTKAHFMAVRDRHPDRFYWFADSIDPRVPGYVERAAQDLDRGASGLKLLPLFVDTEMGDPRWRPIFELLRAQKRPCIIDLSWWYADWPWFAPSVYRKFDSFTAYVQGLGRLLDDFPDVRVQLAHYGAPRLTDPNDVSGTIRYERLDEVVAFMRRHPGVCCDLAAYQHLIRPDEPYPYWRALKIVEVMVPGVGAERVHWGTDWPYLGVQPYPELIRAIREASFLQDGEAEKMLGENALRFVTP
ncbi:MAG: amidohydrolase [candidate division Zixibacteria bacterium]|nr:amidohydrolase [candidate division Zixibacteria bacterium]